MEAGLPVADKAEDELPHGFIWATMVPELLVSDLAASRSFWCGLCGFQIAYERPESRFVYLDRSGRQIMLEAIGSAGRHWRIGLLEQPFGRGINLQITVDEVDPILSAIAAAGWPLFLEPEEVWCRAGRSQTGVRQFLVQDPDGYLVRFSQALGLRSLQTLAIERSV